MCPPHWYEVNYVINPWMAGNLHRPSRDRAFTQWRGLYDALTRMADVRVLHAEPGSPDMTFVAHTAVVQYGIAALSSFAHRQRQPEEVYLRRWLEDAGFLLWDTPRETSFEGEGDAIFDRGRSTLWAAHGARTSQQSHSHLASAWHIDVCSLHLTDPRFYHLDTCFAPLSGGHLLYYPGAFDAMSLRKIEAAFSKDMRIVVSEADATQFACNLINISQQIFMSEVIGDLPRRLRDAGYDVDLLPMSEFICGGGAVKSLALRLSDSPLPV